MTVYKLSLTEVQLARLAATDAELREEIAKQQPAVFAALPKPAAKEVKTPPAAVTAPKQQ